MAQIFRVERTKNFTVMSNHHFKNKNLTLNAKGLLSLMLSLPELFFENYEMQDEIRKLNDEIHRLTTELSETQKLNRSLQQSNDDLRNRNGLKSRSEQEQLEEEIKDVRDQNSKLQIQVNKSSVEAVDEAQEKQKEAEKKARTIEYQFNKAQEEVKTVKKKTDCEIKKLKNEAKEKETFWMIAYMILVLLAVIKNTVFQKDLFACIIVPLRFWYRYIEWLIHPSELNILGEREYFSAGWSWFLRIMAILIFLGLGISSEIFVLRKIEQYRKAWDKYSIFTMLPVIETICLEGIDPNVIESDWVNLENSNLTILVPEDTSDEQLQAIGQKFLEAYIITDISQVKRGTCSMPDDPMPDIAEILSAYGI